MKKFIYLILFTAGIISTQSCVNEEKDIFDESASNRLALAIETCDKYLIDAPNGWLMKYYAGVEPEKLGGYNFICSFENGKISIQTELKVDTIYQSYYKFIANQGPVLTLDTFNDALHPFAEQQGGPYTDKGDFEFIIINSTPEKIELRGKKYGNTIMLSRIPADVSWTDYLEKSLEIEKMLVEHFYFDISVGNKIVGHSVYENTDRLFSFNFGGAENSHIINQNLVYTPDGISFYKPIEIEGKTVQNFRWDELTATFTCIDANSNNITLKSIAEPANLIKYDDYVGRYVVEYLNLYDEPKSKIVTISVKQKNRSHTLTGLAFFPIELTYLSINQGKVALKAQNVSTPNPSTLIRISLVSENLNISNGATTWIQGGLKTNTVNGKMTLAFDESVGGAVVGAILGVYNNSGFSGLYNSDSFFKNIVMTKQ